MAHHESPTSRLVRVTRVAVPAGLAVLTWLVVLLAVGVLAGLTASVMNIVPVILVGLLFWPVFRAAPWRPGVTERMRRFVRTNRDPILVAIALFVLRSVPVTPDLLVSLLDLPFRATGLLFGASVFYRRHVGAAFGRFILDFGQWYLEAFWLFGIGLLVAGVVRRVR